jgi:non-ribosomal peptide synthase protein (TIGR01720 family)
LQTIYQHNTKANANDTGTLVLPLKTTSFKQWSQQLLEYARSKALLELDYWLAKKSKSVSRLPVDFPGGSNTVGSARILSVSLSVAETKALLQKVPAAYRTQINDVLLTALVQAFAQWTGEQSLLVNLEGHGREEIFDNVDLSRTVGWFTSVFPVLLLGDSDPGEALKAIKEQLRSIPNRGIDYGILRYLSNDPFIVESLRSLPQAEVCFNYLGQFDQTLSSPLFKWSSEPRGIERSLRDNRSELLEINGFVVGGQLQLDWTYSQSVHHESTIEALAQGFIEALRSLIAHCQSPEAGGYTPSDFPLAKLDQQTLDELLVQSQIEDIYPLSPIQQGMLFHTLYDPDSGIYCEQFSCTLKGLNISAFKQAWERVVILYPVLRTSFYGEIDTPLQVVHRQVELPWEQQDWRGSLTDQERLEAVLKGDRQGFDLSQAPLMRLILIQLTDNTNLFIWSHHHLLLDGWSMPIVFKDAIAFYQAFSQGQDLNPKRPRPYRDYIAWLQQQDLSKAEVFWQQMLKGFTTPTPLEINPVSPKLPNLEESENKQQIQLSEATAAALLLFTKQHQLTLNTLIQGTWALLLNHYSGAEDVVFGSTVPVVRPTSLVQESIVGVFINTLPVRVQLIPEDSFVSLLKKIQFQQVEARQYEHTPLVQLHKWSDMPRDLPLFESIVVFQNYPVDPSLRQGFREFEFGNIRSSSKNNYPLTVRVLLPDLSLQILYDSCRFQPDAIAQILEHFQFMLHRILGQPDANIRALKEALIEGDKQQQILKQKDFQAVRRQKIGNVRRKTISVATEQLQPDNH